MEPALVNQIQVCLANVLDDGVVEGGPLLLVRGSELHRLVAPLSREVPHVIGLS